MAKNDAYKSEPHRVTAPMAMPRRGDPLTGPEREVVATGILLAKDYLTEGKFDRDMTILMLGIVAKLGVQSEWDQAVKTLPPVRIVER